MQYHIDPQKRPIIFNPVPINENEVFIPINEQYYKGIKPFYLISSFGRVFNKYSGRYLTAYSPNRVENSRFIVNLQFDINGKSKEKRVHLQRCMMISFCYRDDCDSLEVDHADGVWYDNYLSNLEWVTKSENIKRAWKLGIYDRNNLFKEKITCPIKFTM